jgi:hypothetical protein
MGTGYFDAVQQVIMGGNASTVALGGSTEAAQFKGRKRGARAAKETHTARSWKRSRGLA